ncbi:Carbohydrate esterase protein [Salix suchowensis]|nr:Carbohydrate esterase protein [Salix suchowensis]
MPSNDNHQQDTSNTPGEVLNNNHGPGTFNQANGTQNINVYHCSHTAGYQGGAVEEDANSECHDRRAGSDTRPIRRLHHGRELEPYQSIIDSISRISQHVQSFSPLFPRNSTIAGICNEADEIALLIRCVAEQFVRLSRCPRRSYPTPSSLASHALDIRDAELGELIASLPFSGDLHHPSVDAIWVREPAGQDWYSIPLRFCETWTDFAMVIYQYCRNGPEIEYIRQGNWAIVHVEDNHIIDQTSFTSILKSEMRFDIGVIVQLLSAALRTCPQCGHHNKGKATVDGWIRW